MKDVVEKTQQEKNLEKMMNRRAFLKLFIGTVAIAAIPIPNFLLPKEELLNDFWKGETVPSSEGVLTMEMIEEAAQRSIDNMGAPDKIYMSKKSYKKFGKLFGYKIEYRGDRIIHG